MTLLGFGGVFAAITYLSPMLTEVTGVSNQAISWFMVLLGLGMMVGNYFGGKFADKNLFLALAGSLALLTVALLAFGWVLKSAILSGTLIDWCNWLCDGATPADDDDGGSQNRADSCFSA